jgi:L-fuculose-phosphate aldolase
VNSHPAIDELIHCGRSLVAQGMVLGRGGNLSVRVDDTIYVTARGAALDRLTAHDFVAVEVATARVVGNGRPSSELPMHLAAYETDAGTRAVVHTHPPHAIACGIVGLALPALTPDFYVYLGDIVPLLPYLPPGSPALRAAVADALETATSVLLQNHGLLAVGRSVDEAFLRTGLVEETARILLAAHATGRPIHTLSADDRAALKAVRYAVHNPS